MKKKRIAVDISMTVLLPLLMAYSLIGETLHEIIGTVMLVLFICHNWMNRGFWKGLFKGKYNPQRIFRTVINVSLLLMMFLQPLSGIAMSKHLYTFIPQLEITATARQIHMVLAYWSYVLMSIHLGTHLDMVLVGLEKKMNPPVKLILSILCIAASIYGGYAFVKRQLPDYMFMKTPFVFFDYSEPKIFFFMDYLAIMLLCAAVGYLLTKGLGPLSGKKKDKGD